MVTVYAVGLIYNDEWEGEVIQHYSLWSTYKKAKEEAMKIDLRFASAIVVQKFNIDSSEYFEAEIIKSHTSFVRYSC